MDEVFIKTEYPKAYTYLQNKKKLLLQRDKGKGGYPNWFAFGRTQSLEKMSNKRFFPKFSDTPPAI